jgi:hypothetical protein
MIRDLTVAGYLLCVIAALVLVVLSHRRAAPFATLSEVLNEVLADRAVRITIVVFWWWLGWHFLVAQTVDPPLSMSAARIALGS